MLQTLHCTKGMIFTITLIAEENIDQSDPNAYTEIYLKIVQIQKNLAMVVQ